jgi:hypothetical protein
MLCGEFVEVVIFEEILLGDCLKARLESSLCLPECQNHKSMELNSRHLEISYRQQEMHMAMGKELELEASLPARHVLKVGMLQQLRN